MCLNTTYCILNKSVSFSFSEPIYGVTGDRTFFERAILHNVNLNPDMAWVHILLSFFILPLTVWILRRYNALEMQALMFDFPFTSGSMEKV